MKGDGITESEDVRARMLARNMAETLEEGLSGSFGRSIQITEGDYEFTATITNHKLKSIEAAKYGYST